MKRKLLFAAALVASALGFNANAQERPVPNFSPLADDGNTIQYIYNVEAGGFLLGANDWNTRASVSETQGYQFKVAKTDNNTWILNDYVEKDNKGWQAVFAGSVGDIWVDNLGGANVDKWVITELGDNKYKISNPSAVQNGSLGVASSLDDSRVYLTSSDRLGSTWAFVNPDDYTSYLAEYRAWVNNVAYFIAPNTDITPAIGKIGTSINGWDFGEKNTFHVNTWSWEGMEGNGNYDGSWMTPTFLEDWQGLENGSLANGTISYTLSGLVPNQKYTISAFVRAYNEGSATPPQGAYIFAGEGKSQDVSTGKHAFTLSNKAYIYDEFSATGTADEDGNLTIGLVEENNNFNWIAMRDFKVSVKPLEEGEEVAGEAEYKALNEAIAAVESKLGFEVGENAPYTNIAAMKTLKIAKCINQTIKNRKADVLNVIQLLNKAEWTANTEEMNAIFDGSFEYNYEESVITPTANGYRPLGWYQYNNKTFERPDNPSYSIRLVSSNVNAGVGATTSGKGLFTKTTAFYGLDEEYSMPLKENTYYTVSFIASGWGDCEDLTDYVDIISPSGTTERIKTFAVNANDGDTNTTNWVNVTATFKTGEAGKYVLNLVPRNNNKKVQNQFVYGDFKLFKDVITIDEAEEYDATLEGTANVVLNRTIKEGINTLVLPFDLSQEEVEEAFGEDATVYVPKTYANDNITFEAADGIEANVPCLLDAAEAGTEYEFKNVTLVAAESTETEVDGLTMIGVYENGKVATDENNYIVYENSLYLVDSEVAIKTTRAYFNVVTEAPVKAISISFGGEATGIVNVPTAEAKTGKIYDLQGREVKNPARGIYIIDGQKVLIGK